MITRTTTVKPAVEPVTLTEAKLHARVDASEDNALVTALIVAAREYVEDYTSKSLVTQTHELKLDAWPEDVIELPRGPVQAVSSITYLKSDGTTGTVTAADYVVTTGHRGRVALADGASWPTDTLSPIGAVKVTYTAGYGAAAVDVPAKLKQAILLLVGHWYAFREAAISGANIAEVPFAVKALLDSEKAVAL